MRCIYGVRSRNHAAFLTRLRDAPYAHQVRIACEDEAGRLDVHAILSSAVPDSHIYVCGPAGLVDSFVRHSADLGWTEDRIHREFFGSGPGDDATNNREFHVIAVRSGVTVTVKTDQSIASALTDAGVPVTVFASRESAVPARQQYLLANPITGTTYCPPERSGRTTE